MENNICIGIVSYLPSLEPDRSIRRERALNLISQCDLYFKLPIILIIQNWGEFNYKPKNSKIILYNYKNKLGVLGARITLREKFLKSNYSGIILLDDDLKLSSESAAKDYLSMIKDKEFYSISGWLMNYSYLSRDGFKKVWYDEKVNPEMNSGFEDWLLWEKCNKKLSNIKLNSNLPVGRRRDYLRDEYSTWSKSTDKNNKINSEINSRATINKFKELGLR